MVLSPGIQNVLRFHSPSLFSLFYVRQPFRACAPFANEPILAVKRLLFDETSIIGPISPINSGHFWTLASSQ